MNPNEIPNNLGTLCAMHESQGDSGAIGHNGPGGWSYGAFQIATTTGTLGRFLAFCRRYAPPVAEALDQAGGDVENVVIRHAQFPSGCP